MRRFMLAGLLITNATRATAQQAQPVGVTAAVIPDGEPRSAPSIDVRTGGERSIEVGERILLASIGSAAGFIAGANAGTWMFRGNGAHGEFAALDREIQGAALGSVLGASTVAAVPRLGSTCKFAKRMSFSLLGSASGMVAGTAIGLTSHNLGGAALGMALGAAGGAGLGEAFC